MVAQVEKGTGARNRDRAVVAAGAVVAAVLAWVLAVVVPGQDVVVTQPGNDPMTLNVGAVVLFSAVPALLAWGLLVVLERVVPRWARVTWAVVAVAVLALSFGPVASVEATGGDRATLAMLHLVVGVVLIPGMWGTFRR